jgi:hypothetical protein
MGTWVSILVAFSAGIWGTIQPETVLRFMFEKHYEKRGKCPTSGAKLIMRVVSILTLASSVYLATQEIVMFYSS